MKKLEVNQMENLQGGSGLGCFAAMAAQTAAVGAWGEDPNEINTIALVGATAAMFDACM